MSEYSCSAYAMRAMHYARQEELRERRRKDDVAERAYLRSLKWTEREIFLYQQRVLGIEMEIRARV